MKLTSRVCTIGAAVMTTAGTVQGVMLLDNGVVSTYTAWGISGSMRTYGGFTQFQPFTVPDTAWQLQNIGVFGCDGYTVGTGDVARLYPDRNGRPNESVMPLASADYTFAALPGAWAYRTFNVTLPAGRYWLVMSAPVPLADDDWLAGLRGENGFSRRGMDGAEFVHQPLSLRINGTVVPEPVTAVTLALLGAGLCRRPCRS